MTKKILSLVIIFVVFFLNTGLVFADVVQPGRFCRTGGVDTCNRTTGCPTCDCIGSSPGSTTGLCQTPGAGGSPTRSPADVFGKITPPPPLDKFISGDPTGAGGIGKFVSNLIALIYSIAIIVLVLMILWGAFDWLTSEGDKEKLENARKKLINAIVGIMLFAIAFAVIRVLGQFTGFTFFVGQ